MLSAIFMSITLVCYQYFLCKQISSACKKKIYSTIWQPPSSIKLISLREIDCQRLKRHALRLFEKMHSKSSSCLLKYLQYSFPSPHLNSYVASPTPWQTEKLKLWMTKEKWWMIEKLNAKSYLHQWRLETSEEWRGASLVSPVTSLLNFITSAFVIIRIRAEIVKYQFQFLR